ncbi:hypothetical protein BaRGS_00013830, partial [Batillaria attramentaria]
RQREGREGEGRRNRCAFSVTSAAKLVTQQAELPMYHRRQGNESPMISFPLAETGKKLAEATG